MYMMEIPRRSLYKKEQLFFFAILAKMIVQSISMSVIPEMIGMDLCKYIFKIMTYSSYLIVVVSFLLDPFFKARELIIISIVIAVSVAGSVFSGNEIMLTIIYLYGAKNINIERVIKKLGICNLLLFSLIILLSQIGIIEDWDFFKNTDRPRWGLGYTYPTHTSSALFMAVLLFCYIKKSKLNLFYIVLIEMINYWVFRRTDS